MLRLLPKNTEEGSLFFWGTLAPFVFFVPLFTVGLLFLFDVIPMKTKTFGSEELRFANFFKSALDQYDDPRVCLDNLKIAYDSLFAKTENHPPPSLGDLLTESYVMAMQLPAIQQEVDPESKNKTQETDTYFKARMDRILALVKLQRAEEPYAGLPYSDRELLDDIKDKLTNLDPAIAKPLVNHLADVLLEKNDEAVRYQNETSRANQITILSFIVTVTAFLLTLISFIRWKNTLRPKSRHNASPTGAEP